MDAEKLQLAIDMDGFMYDYDPYGYHDAVDDREQAIMELASNLLTESYFRGIINYLSEVAEEHDEWEQKALTLMNRMMRLFIEDKQCE